MLYHVKPRSMAARTLSAEDEQLVQRLTLTDSQTVAATDHCPVVSLGLSVVPLSERMGKATRLLG
eukprot:5944701-Pleurochrysis_carterae.AAC.1